MQHGAMGMARWVHPLVVNCLQRLTQTEKRRLEHQLSLMKTNVLKAEELLNNKERCARPLQQLSPGTPQIHFVNNLDAYESVPCKSGYNVAVLVHLNRCNTKMVYGAITAQTWCLLRMSLLDGKMLISQGTQYCLPCCPRYCAAYNTVSLPHQGAEPHSWPEPDVPVARHHCPGHSPQGAQQGAVSHRGETQH